MDRKSVPTLQNQRSHYSSGLPNAISEASKLLDWFLFLTAIAYISVQSKTRVEKIHVTEPAIRCTPTETRFEEPRTLYGEKTSAPTTFLTHTLQENVYPYHCPSLADGAALGGSREELTVSKAQLLVAILTLLGVGKLIEFLVTRIWKALVSCPRSVPFSF
jgi:hypothetical protein